MFKWFHLYWTRSPLPENLGYFVNIWNESSWQQLELVLNTCKCSMSSGVNHRWLTLSQRPPSPGRREKFAFSPKKEKIDSKKFLNKSFSPISSDFQKFCGGWFSSDDSVVIGRCLQVDGWNSCGWQRKKKGKEQNQEKKKRGTCRWSEWRHRGKWSHGSGGG